MTTGKITLTFPRILKNTSTFYKEKIFSLLATILIHVNTEILYFNNPNKEFYQLPVESL